MTQFIEGLDRQQTMLLPEHLDDYVGENSPEVTMFGFDRDALSMMAVAARDEMTTDQLTAIAPLVHAAHTLPGSG